MSFAPCTCPGGQSSADPTTNACCPPGAVYDPTQSPAVCWTCNPGATYTGSGCSDGNPATQYAPTQCVPSSGIPWWAIGLAVVVGGGLLFALTRD